MDDCLICRKHRGEISSPGKLYEDDLVVASHPLIAEGEAEAYLGILFIEPKRHVPGMA
jgi:histidine triad (HIT) family protein